MAAAEHMVVGAAELTANLLSAAAGIVAERTRYDDATLQCGPDHCWLTCRRFLRHST